MDTLAKMECSGNPDMRIREYCYVLLKYNVPFWEDYITNF